MKNNFLLWLSLGLILFLQSQTGAQWMQTGPVGGWIEDLKVSGNTLYAASYGGVLISTDNGIDWTHSNWGLLDGDITAVAATSSKVYAGTYWSGVYMKDLYGLIWQPTSLANQAITCLTTIGEYVFAGTYSTGVWLSTDNGSTWTQVNTGLTAFQVQCFTTKGTDIYVGIEGGGVFRSTNYGTEWTQVNNGLPSDSPISLAVNGDNLYVGLWANGIYTSPNNGQGWIFFGQPLGYPSSFAFDGTDIYVCGSANGVYYTNNNGVDWIKLSNGIPSTSQLRKISFIGTNLVVGESTVNEGSQGLFISTNHGADWSHIDGGLPKYCSNAIAANNGKLFSATCGSIYRSTNSGTSWNKPTIHGARNWADFTSVAFLNNLNGFAGDVNGFSYKSTNGGDDWTCKAQIEDGASVTSFAFISTSIFASTKPYLAGVEGGVYLSMDNADTWTRVSTGLPTLADTNTVVNSLSVIGTNLFAGTGHGIYLSTDNGSSWTKVSNGLTGSQVCALTAMENELFAGLYEEGVFRSNDNGTTWTQTSLVENITALGVVDTNLVAGTWSHGVYKLNNHDSTWTPVGLTGKYITSFTSDGSYIYAGTNYNSVWKRPLLEVTDLDEQNQLDKPSVFNLYQNYPNPFNPSTKIRFALKSPGMVSLKVYDILGNEIKTLVNEEKAAGTYEAKFNAKELSSGIYFYKIQTGSYSSTRKMLLIK